jgi:hypothetical protein
LVRRHELEPWTRRLTASESIADSDARINRTEFFA